jgi:hypothetical protein
MSYNYYHPEWEYEDGDHNNTRDVLKGCLHMILTMIAFIVLLCLVLSMVSCKGTEYVTIPQQHTEHHWHTDSIIKRDSVVKESKTTVMQLDSAAMAKYGIQLKNAEKAWLVKSEEMERTIQELLSRSEHKDTVRDSIPVPYPIEKQVPTELTWWQQTKMHIGGVVFWLALLAFFLWLGKKKLKL